MSNTYLTDIDFSAPASEDSCGAHIAYTFEFQGGAASGYNTPLMFKGQEQTEISFNKIEKLESLGEDVTELRKSYVGQIMNQLGEALNEKFSSDWEWIYVVDADFDNNIVIFCSDYGMFSVGFELNGLVVTLEDVAQPVVQTTDYQIVEGDVLVSIDFFDNLLDQALSDMIKASFKHKHVKDLLIKAKDGKSEQNSVIAEPQHPAGAPSANTQTHNGDATLDNINKEDFIKSAEFQDIIKKALAEEVEKAAVAAKAEAEAAAQEAILKAQAEAAELRKAEKARIEADYTAVVKSYGFIEEADLSTVVKHLVENTDVAELLVKAFDKAQAEVEAVKKEFGKELGLDVENQQQVAKSANELMRQKAEAIKARAK